MRQHADNPVFWYPWCEEAFHDAKKFNKPIMLSIGYSACHWCHVMAHESFEDQDTADILNDSFINIKVDREERPDIDKIYQMAQTSIHPDWYPNAKVYCDGQLILKVGSTKPRLNVDIWSGNHPFYTGSQKILDTEGRVERFMRKYGIEKTDE